MTGSDQAGRLAGHRPPKVARGRILSSLGAWRWRLAGIALVFAYLAQDALDLPWQGLYALQKLDWFKYLTGSCLFLYIVWLWSLFLLRLNGLKGRKAGRLMTFHERSGVFAPLLFYLHSVQIGYGYLAALGWIFLGAIAVGTASPVGMRVPGRGFRACWMAVHAMLAMLMLILGLYHAYIAFYYK